MTQENTNQNDFGSVLDQQMDGFRSDFEVGERLTGMVTAVDSKSVFVDVNARSEGILDRGQVTDENGELTVQPGDTIDVYFMGGEDDELRLTTRLSGDTPDSSLVDAFQAGIPVEGRVESERTGGYEIRISNQRAFCPYSQIDIFRNDPGAYIGNKFRFQIIEYDDNGRNLVVSRRQLLQKERDAQKARLKEELTEGAVVEGKITKLMPFGAFCDIGGMEGLIPMRELGWGHTEKAEDVVREGDQVTVVVQEMDWDRERIALSLRKAQGDPWDSVAGKYPVGSRLEGSITKLMPFGAFVELEPGVEGLVHVSKLGAGRRINHPKEVVKEGDLVEVSVESVDVERRRLSLSMENTAGIEDAVAGDEGGAPIVLRVGATVNGVVDGIKDFGVFVRLGANQTGLLHISQVNDIQGRDREGALRHRFPPGSTAEVVIKEMKGDRISLALPGDFRGDPDNDTRTGEFMQDSQGENLGSLGDALEGLDL
ncbi:MAG: S1 RNA-binding domain-containing protein [Candidatus Pacebacteria bacterium]|nr:S1 RNA-binding domain-containing protein [Candidatus Paceibacterota bacterium]